jgi:hypothetical protein
MGLLEISDGIRKQNHLPTTESGSRFDHVKPKIQEETACARGNPQESG